MGLNSKQCKIEGCNYPVWSGGLCKRHINYSPIKSKRNKEFKKEEVSQMRDFFLSIWNKRPHRSEISNTYLGSEPLTVFFHHILPKSRYKDAALDEENIILLTLDEHTNCESDMYRYEEINRRRLYLIEKYDKNDM